MEIIAPAISFIVKVYSCITSGPALSIQAVRAIDPAKGDLKHGYNFSIYNKGSRATSIRNMHVIIYNSKSKKEESHIIVPRDVLISGVRMEDIKNMHSQSVITLMRSSSQGYVLEPGHQWDGFIQESKDIFTKHIKVYMKFSCSHRSKPVKIRLRNIHGNTK